MRKLTQFELKRPSEFHDSCKYFDTEDNSFFCIQIENDLLRFFIYDVLMNALKSDIIDPAFSERYLKLVYAHHGLKRCIVTVTIQDESEIIVSTVDFDPREFQGDLAAEILLEEVRLSEIEHGPFEVFSPTILLDENEKILKNALEDISAPLFELPTLLIDGDELPRSIRDEILKNDTGIINVTKSFKNVWNLKEVFEGTIEDRKEEI